MPTVLVIEDDEPIRRGIVTTLDSAGYRTIEAATGPAGVDEAVGATIDLVLLDVLLPGFDGFDVLAKVRTAHPALPVIMLTARGTEEDRVRGLRGGADDYVVKPFSPAELLARVEAVLRRSPERPCGVANVNVAGRTIDFERRLITLPDGKHEQLSESETALLMHLSAHRGRVVARAELLRHVWGIDPSGVETRAVDKHVARLREKLADDPREPTVLITVRARGYMLGE